VSSPGPASPGGWRGLLRLGLRVARAYSFDRCGHLAAGLAFYAVFSMPAVLVVVFSLGGMVLEPGSLEDLVGAHLGPAGGDAVSWAQARWEAATGGGRGWAGLAAGLGGVLFAASTALTHLQAALNQAWNVAPDPEKGWLASQLQRRGLGLVLVLAGAVLLILSVGLSGPVEAALAWAATWLPHDVGAPVGRGGAFLVSSVLFGTLFTLLYWRLPDAEVDLRDAASGGVVAGVLLAVGNGLLGWLLGSLDLTSVYGAAGSLALFMLWLHGAASLLLLGAELAQILAHGRGRPILPRPGAQRVEVVHRRLEEGGRVVEETRELEPGA